MHGQFSVDPETVWLTGEGGSDRTMRLLRAFSFTDPGGRVWLAPEGSVVDGASIPRALWTTVGSPYTGNYRRASIVHDVACVAAAGDPARRREADRMFFHACRAGGCSISEATVLYVGVRIGAAASPFEALARDSESVDARTVRTNEESRFGQLFKSVAERALSHGESNDPLDVEHWTDEAMAEVAGLEGLGV